jgi:microcystin-dependent protein
MDAYLGEIRLFSFTYGQGVRGWLRCDGSILPISNYQALFSLIGTTYGGNGTATFSLPDLRGRVIAGAISAYGTSPAPYSVGYAGGVETVILTMPQIPAHQHYVQVSDQPGDTITLANSIYAGVTLPSPANLYAPMSVPPVPVEPTTILPDGGGQAHANIQPSLGLAYYISIQGIYPSRP